MIVSVPVKLITFPAAAQIAEVVAWEATVAYAPFIKLDAVSVVNAPVPGAVPPIGPGDFNKSAMVIFFDD